MIPNRVDIPRLAGVTSFLGLEFSDSVVRVTELVKHGSLLHRYKCRFTVRVSASAELPQERDLRKWGEIIGVLLEKNSVKTRRAVIGIAPSSGKFVDVTMPSTVENVDEWISDHVDEVLKLPIAPTDIRFAYQKHHDGGDGRICVAFVRKRHLDDLRAMCEQAGLDIVGIRVTPSESSQPELVQSINELTKEYHPAALLAVQGFFPESGSFDFLSGDEKASMETSMYKSLFQRTVVATGMLLVFLLLLPFVISQAIDFKEAAIEEHVLAMGPAYGEVKLLERQVENLRNQISRGQAGANRSDVSRFLYGLATSAPDGVWFSKLNVSESGARVMGYARSSDQIASFMRSLEENRVTNHVSLVRTEHSAERRLTVSVKNVPPAVISFELSMIQ